MSCELREIDTDYSLDCKLCGAYGPFYLGLCNKCDDDIKDVIDEALDEQYA